MGAGALWIVDAYGCDVEALRSPERLAAVFDEIVRALGLTAVEPARWHRFPGAGGVTGFVVLSESHLACHTYPETKFATFDLHCCRREADWPWEDGLASRLGAERVVVRSLTRGEETP